MNLESIAYAVCAALQGENPIKAWEQINRIGKEDEMSEEQKEEILNRIKELQIKKDHEKD